MPKWDYRVLAPARARDPAALEALLQQHGRDGWELVAVIRGGWLVLKRLASD